MVTINVYNLFENKRRKGELNMRKDKGITLIALVITIIILIILAAIAISAVFGENGLIVRAREAAFKTEVSVIKEQVEMAKIQIGKNGEYSTRAAVNLADIIPDNQKAKYYTGGTKLDVQGIWNKRLGYYDNKESGEFSGLEKKWLQDIGIYPLGPGLAVGAYVAYTPTAADQVTIPNTRTGYNDGVGNQTFNQDPEAISTPSDAKWRYLMDDEKKPGNVLLISAAPLNRIDNGGGLELHGAIGYNNIETIGSSEGILDEICRKLYSNTNLKTKARSLTGEEIDQLCGITWYRANYPTEFGEYQEPMLATSEIYGDTGYIYGASYTFGSDYYIPDADSPNGYRELLEDITITDTYVMYDYGKAAEIVDDILQIPLKDSEGLGEIFVLVGEHWLSGRMVFVMPAYASFVARHIAEGGMGVWGTGLFDSNGNQLEGPRLPLRPVVSVPYDAIDWENGNGEAGTPFQMK